MRFNAFPFFYTPFITLMVLMTLSCEGISGGRGVVLAPDNSPVWNAQVVLFFNDRAVDTVFTDTTGSFTAQQEFKSLFYHPDSKLLISKEGYMPVTVPVSEKWYKDPEFDKERITVRLVTGP